MGYKVASILYIHHCSKVIGISKKTLFERMFLFSLQLFLHRIYRLMTSVIIKRNVLHVLLLAVTRVLVTLPHFFFIRTGVACFQKSQTLTRHSTAPSSTACFFFLSLSDVTLRYFSSLFVSFLGRPLLGLSSTCPVSWCFFNSAWIPHLDTPVWRKI